VRIDLQKSQTHRDRYPDTKGDGKTKHVVVIIASLIYRHNNLTAIVHNNSLVLIYQKFTENGKYNYIPKIKGVEFAMVNYNWRVSNITSVTENDVWNLIDEVDAITDMDDRIALIWISHGFYDSDNKIGALGLYNHYIDDQNRLNGDYIDSYELAKIISILGPALDFTWFIACGSDYVVMPDPSNPSYQHPIWELADVAAVTYTYTDKIVFSPLQSISDTDRQISDFVTYAFDGNQALKKLFSKVRIDTKKKTIGKFGLGMTFI